jgi:hypothetical protein
MLWRTGIGPTPISGAAAPSRCMNRWQVRSFHGLQFFQEGETRPRGHGSCARTRVNRTAGDHPRPHAFAAMHHPVIDLSVKEFCGSPQGFEVLANTNDTVGQPGLAGGSRALHLRFTDGCRCGLTGLLRIDVAIALSPDPIYEVVRAYESNMPGPRDFTASCSTYIP